MDDLLEDAGPGNAPEFTVSELTGAVKRTLEGAFGRVRVRGEIGRVMRARSGHVYYDVKDDRNVISCTTWKGQVAGLGMMPEEGLEVIVTGRLTTYGPQSRYNLNVDRMEVAGEGALMAMLEKRRRKLAGEGLFDEARKRPLPYLPEVIGVVTSPSGAVIRDILHRLADRFPRRVLVWPVAVQGERCAPEVTAAIRGFNALPEGGPIPRPDLLIVARGGGSLEDLWGFNEESVVRAAAESAIPLISAVGHETDTTLIDHASDRRAPTPTAAAELAVPVRRELWGWVQQQGGHMDRAVAGLLAQRGQRLRDLARGLPRADALLDTPRQKLDRVGDRLAPALRSNTQTHRARADRAAARLAPALERAMAKKRLELGRTAARLAPARLGGLAREGRRRLADLARSLDPGRLAYRAERARGEAAALFARLDRAARADHDRRRREIDRLEALRQTLGYTATLRRGYAVVRAGEAVITGKAEAERREALEIEFADGKLAVRPETEGGPGPGARRGGGRSGGGSGRPTSQGDLFG